MSKTDNTDAKHNAKITEADWLKCGYVLKLKLGGGIDVVQSKSLKKTPAERAHATALIIDKLVKQADCGSIFVSKEDCSLVLEYYPGLLKR